MKRLEPCENCPLHLAEPDSNKHAILVTIFIVAFGYFVGRMAGIVIRRHLETQARLDAELNEQFEEFKQWTLQRQTTEASTL